jgi:hypothetical protein
MDAKALARQWARDEKNLGSNLDKQIDKDNFPEHQSPQHLNTLSQSTVNSAQSISIRTKKRVKLKSKLIMKRLMPTHCNAMGVTMASAKQPALT